MEKLKPLVELKERRGTLVEEDGKYVSSISLFKVWGPKDKRWEIFRHHSDRDFDSGDVWISEETSDAWSMFTVHKKFATKELARQFLVRFSRWYREPLEHFWKDFSVFEMKILGWCKFPEKEVDEDALTEVEDSEVDDEWPRGM
jgi:hypothetical protein